MKTLVVYHRGGGKSLGYPPNCLITIKWALNHGAKVIEYDVVAARDNDQFKIIVIEPKLLAEHGLDIDALNWDEVKKLDTGNTRYGHCEVATLEDVFGLLNPAVVSQQIHIKGRNPHTVPTLVGLLNRISNFTVSSFDLSVLAEIKGMTENLKTGWIVKLDMSSGNEGMQDLTKLVSSNPTAFASYTKQELELIVEKSSTSNIDVIILCGPKIQDRSTVSSFQGKGFEVGAWGVGTNLEIANRLIAYGIDRFTIDNPEQL